MIDDLRVFLSTEPANRRDRRFALAAALLCLAVFLATAPFAGTQLAQVPAFIPIYVTTLVICDLITAVLLFGQFHFLRTPALLALASGYLFTAFATIAYVLIFPGLFSPPGLLGAGSQTSSALYMFWHGGFPLFVIGYALLKGGRRDAARSTLAILCAVAGVLAAVCGFTLLATAGHDSLPTFLQGNRTTDTGRAVLSGIWLLSLLALGALWRRRPRAVLDVWLMVVMWVWLLDLALSAVINTGRYDLGWYAGRVYGVLSASFLLAVLLTENGTYHKRLAQLSAGLRAANRALEQLSLHDALTGLANRRYFDKHLADQAAISQRYQRPLALVLYDVDSFKAFNDRYGHPAGDECLKQIAAAIGSCCHRPADLAARYGGEEFAMILPDTELAGAAQVAETARSALAHLNIPHLHSAAACVSLSGGVALLQPGMTPQQLVAAADQALYQAKGQGRNRIVVCSNAHTPAANERMLAVSGKS